MDSQRFGQIAKGLHAATNFEEASTRRFENCKGSLLVKLDSKLLAVSGPLNSLDILSTADMSLVVNLNTEGKMPFCAVRFRHLLIVGCTSGHLYTWNIDLGFQERKCVKVSQKISQIVIFTAQPKVGESTAPQQYLLVAEDTGLFTLMKL